MIYSSLIKPKELADKLEFTEGDMHMEQSTFWLVSSINFLLVIIMGIINLCVTRNTAIKLGKSNEKYKNHEKLMETIVLFQNAVDKTKTIVLSTQTTREDAPKALVDIKKNEENMQIAYKNLKIFLHYSLTDYTDVVLAAEGLVNKREIMYKLVRDILYVDSFGDAVSDGAIKQSTENAIEYNRLMHSDCKESVFEGALNRYITDEMTAIKAK